MANKSMRLKSTVGCLGALLLALPSAEALSFTINEFSGDPSSVRISITQNGANSLNFVLEIVDPESPSRSDLSGFWAHIADESLLSGLKVSSKVTSSNGEKFNPDTSYVFQKGANNVGLTVGHSNNNLNGGTPALNPFDLGFYFGSSNGLDKIPINIVSFTLTHNGGLSESLFENQLFGVRLQPLEFEADGKKVKGSAKLAGTSPSSTPLPDGGASIALLGMALTGLQLLRRKLG